MAIATVVLVGVGVSIRSLVRLQYVPLGFSARHLVYAGIDVQRSGHEPRTGPAFYHRLRERVRAEPASRAFSTSSDREVGELFPYNTVAGLHRPRHAVSECSRQGGDAIRPVSARG
jgi:hypothetical protein